MDMTRRIEAFRCVETLLGNGHRFSDLPISKEKAVGIIDFREEVSEDDLRLLQDAVCSRVRTIAS